MHIIANVIPFLFPFLISAASIPQTPFAPEIAVGALSVAQILKVAPNSASCASAAYPAECTTAEQATKYLNLAFQKYNTQTLGQKAALLGTMAFESADFAYNINHFPAPGRPGQGTKSMMMFDFVYEYALAQPELTKQVQQLMHGSTVNTASNSTKNDVRALVLGDNYTFGSASWYLVASGNCPGAVDALDENAAGFNSYVTNCLGTTLEAGRITKWCAAVDAMLPVGMAKPSGC